MSKEKGQTGKKTHPRGGGGGGRIKKVPEKKRGGEGWAPERSSEEKVKNEKKKNATIFWKSRGANTERTTWERVMGGRGQLKRKTEKKTWNASKARRVRRQSGGKLFGSKIAPACKNRNLEEQEWCKAGDDSHLQGPKVR